MDIKDQHIRNFLRVLAGITLIFYIYDFGYHKVRHEPIFLTPNDGYLIGGCVVLLLAIEAVRMYVKKKIKNLNN